ncbi:unnamed protein product [Pleuronectes platessa]|uniref:Uncharacterized protein n=1 Tax=Pleuronectes platessa TaxID=8262 RepID=A0A9N7UAM2_PLEPL|nr:unnamed protein product [Pleuronectes platessa]
MSRARLSVDKLLSPGCSRKSLRQGFCADVGESPRGTSPRRCFAPAGCISSLAVRRGWLWVGMERLGAGGLKTTSKHLAQGHFGMQMGQTGDRTADPQVGGGPLYPSATAAHK